MGHEPTGISLSGPRYKARADTRLVAEDAELKAISAICSLFTELSPGSKAKVASALRAAASLAERDQRQQPD
jgi:hypothetical protein